MMRVALTTLGCKANWSDTEAVAQALAAAGLDIVDFEDDAEVYVVNTCTVTALASAQSRQMLNRARKRSPAACVIAAGCYGEVARDKLVAMREVDGVFGTSDREGLISFILERAGIQGECAARDRAFGPVACDAQSRARAFLKIQEGCDKACAYCIIAKARGPSRSLAPSLVVSAAKRLGEHHQEIILVGIDLGQYGGDLSPKVRLFDLVKKLVTDERVPRIRLSSLDPKHAGAELGEIISSGGLCRHVHLSIQSGSDAVLRRMRRGYGARDVKGSADALARAAPGIAITGDIIAGFPGETEADHRATLSLLESMPIAGLHVFPFSPREGTPAASMPGQVSCAMRRRRASELRTMAAKKRGAFLQHLIGKSMDVIVTSREADGQGMVKAFSDNAIELRLPAGRIGYGAMGKAAITRVNGVRARGEWR